MARGNCGPPVVFGAAIVLILTTMSYGPRRGLLTGALLLVTALLVLWRTAALSLIPGWAKAAGLIPLWPLAATALGIAVFHGTQRSLMEILLLAVIWAWWNLARPREKSG